MLNLIHLLGATLRNLNTGCLMAKKDNLIWIDLEMTGLEPASDLILEIATIVTDGQLNTIEEGPVLAIHQSDEVLENMNEWLSLIHI